jgi:glycosyltransferase involved in cell wall biosynthesis
VRPKLSVVIPAYNEARNLPLLLERAAVALARPGVELLIVNNGSKDDSAAVLNELLPRYAFARSVNVPVNQGYGFGILSGLRAAEGEVLAWTHADNQTDPGDTIRGLEHFEKATDPTKLFVKGRRYGRPAADVFFTAGMSVFETILMGKALSDINAQPTMFHRKFWETWRNPPHDFSLDLYAFYMARQAGLTVERFPVEFGKRAHGVSHWNVNWQAKVKFIRRTLDYSFQLKRELKEAQ